MAFSRSSKAWTKAWGVWQKTLGVLLVCACIPWLAPHAPPQPTPNLMVLSAERCSVKLTSSCVSARSNVASAFTDIYISGKWESLSPSSHTRSGSGSTIQGAFETIVNLEPKLRELNISSIADIPSGDCGWQFALPSVNTAQAYFGGDITPHVAEENARRYLNHHNKVFAFWDLVECQVPQWSTTCDSVPHSFDLVIVRDVIQHMTIDSAMKALKSVVLDSGATYLAVTSYSSEECQDQRRIAITTDGDFYRNNLHCSPWNLPEPSFKFMSHLHFHEEDDSLEIYRIADLAAVVSSWAGVPHMLQSRA